MTHVDLPQDLASQDLTGAGSIFANRSFLSLWTAQVLSQLASNMVLAGLMATVVATTGSNTANAVLILTFLFPAVAFSAIAGVIVERADAKLIMFGSNALRAVGTVLFIFVGTNVLLIYVINLLIATVTAFFAPADGFHDGIDRGLRPDRQRHLCHRLWLPWAALADDHRQCDRNLRGRGGHVRARRLGDPDDPWGTA